MHVAHDKLIEVLRGHPFLQHASPQPLHDDADDVTPGGLPHPPTGIRRTAALVASCISPASMTPMVAVLLAFMAFIAAAFTPPGAGLPFGVLQLQVARP